MLNTPNNTPKKFLIALGIQQMVHHRQKIIGIIITDDSFRFYSLQANLSDNLMR